MQCLFTTSSTHLSVINIKRREDANESIVHWIIQTHAKAYWNKNYTQTYCYFRMVSHFATKLNS
ncbi:hypothetical protein RchiOBHm_Chr6g0282381 [Rosa chinensis]|uniref:Uncharacterized protein n=1 Tax=Rosa chinensis TaxID=74649 RepID=A0A2P6PTR4_ROSCH|nr:hypothetical protein RchiOBHm_Chr6g0282381 [Rosa chinensis]